MKFSEAAGLVITVCLIVWIPVFLYLKFGIGKWFYHDFLGWHTPGKYSAITSDGVNTHSTCKYCHKRIMQDSQGNWFEA